jgi:4-amino-4-deoxy-L-arabinose transferase-like glycosyltransferase
LMEGNLIWIGMMWSLCSVFTHAGLIFSWMHRMHRERESQFRVWRNESSARSALVIISIPIKHITTLTNSRSVSQVARGQQHRNGRNFQIKILFSLFMCVCFPFISSQSR